MLLSNIDLKSENGYMVMNVDTFDIMRCYLAAVCPIAELVQARFRS